MAAADAQPATDENLPSEDATATEEGAPAEETATGEELPTDPDQALETDEEIAKKIAEDKLKGQGKGKKHGGGGPGHDHHPFDGKPLGDNFGDMEKDIAGMAMLTPAGAMVAKAVEIATDETIDSLGKAELANAALDTLEDMSNAGKGKGEDPAHVTAEDIAAYKEAQETEDADEEAGAEAEETPAAENASIQHFSPEAAATSSFSPLSPEEQRNQQRAAEDAHGRTYSEPGEEEALTASAGDNVVANAVADSLTGNSADLNGIGDNLAMNGVDVQREVSELNPDIAEDMSHASADGDEADKKKDVATANNLAVEAGSVALAARDASRQAVAAAIHGNETDTAQKAETTTELASKAAELADLSSGLSAATGDPGPAKLVADAQKVAASAQETADKATAVVEEKKKEEEEEKDDDEDGKTTFSADDYPELKELEGSGDIGTITG